MKLLGFKLILLLLVLGVGVPMIMPGPDGKPIMTVDDWIPHDTIAWFKRSFGGLSDLVEEGQDSFQPGSTGAGTQIYTWRDDSGVLHYSDTPVDGAGTVLVPQNGLEIPSDRFVKSGLTPSESDTDESQRSSATLLNERVFPGKSKSGAKDKTQGASLSDIEALANGDFSNAGDVIRDLPALMEQLKQAKQGVRAE